METENLKRERKDYQEFKVLLDRVEEIVKTSTMPRLMASVVINRMWKAIGDK